MARLRRAQRDLHRIPVAHFAHQNHLGRLSEGGAQAAGEAVEIRPQFALVEGGGAVRVDVLHRILQRDDMHRFGLVDVIEYRGQGSGFARTGRTGDQHQAGFFLRNLPDDLGKVQPLQRRDDGVELP